MPEPSKQRGICTGAMILALAGGLASAQTPVEPVQEVAIGHLLADADGNSIPDALNGRFRVRGVVTAGSTELQVQNYQLLVEDDSGGVSLFARGKPFPEITRGTRVVASGQLGQFRGAPQVFLDQLEVVGEAALPEPPQVPLAEADSWQHMGRRVRVEGLAGPLAMEGFARLRLDGDDGSALQLYVPQPVVGHFDWNRYPRGSRLAVTGVVSIFKETWPYDGGFQLVVSQPDDIEVLAPPMAEWKRWGLRASLPAAVLIALTVLVFLLAQRRQRLRQQELGTLGALSAAFASSELDARQLARRAADTLTAYGVVEAALVYLGDESGALRCVAASTDSPAHQRRVEAARLGDGDALSSGPGAALTAAGMPPLACHPLPASDALLGWLAVPALQRHRLNPMQQRILLAAVKLLALALENRRIREQAEAERMALHQLAATDDLTGLYNRRFLDEFLRVQIPMAQRRGSGLAFLTLDIDHFKPINDRYGHPLGDTVLRRIADALRKAARTSDLLVRMGGEEFLVVAAETELAGAQALAERIRARVAAINFDDLGLAQPLRVTVSIGLALFGLHGDDADSLLRASDEALYAAKNSGRNRVAVAAAAGGASDTAS